MRVNKNRQNHAQNLSSKLSKAKRKELVAQCLIDRYSVEQTQECVFEQTNTLITIRTIETDRNEIKVEATKFFYTLAKDKNEYNSMLKITIDSLESILSDLRKEYYKASNIFTKLKVTEVLLRYEKEVYEYYKFLPMTHLECRTRISSRRKE